MSNIDRESKLIIDVLPNGAVRFLDRPLEQQAETPLVTRSFLHDVAHIAKGEDRKSSKAYRNRLAGKAASIGYSRGVNLGHIGSPEGVIEF